MLQEEFKTKSGECCQKQTSREI